MRADDDALQVLACEIDKRPQGAPSFFDVAGALCGVRREGDTLIARYDAKVKDRVEQLVAAERQCCPEIAWELVYGRTVEVHIRATPAQLDVFEQFLTR